MAEGCERQRHYIATVYRRGPGGAARQAVALRQEGVTVEDGSLGELRIDFATYGWFPSHLPSEGPNGDG
ncbi:MAG: hypothetical protein Q9191_002088 [Dirinaria sp. TL-2023a]